MGVLYLVATPIGNLEDITLRALRVLREVPLIAAEDTRHTGRLLKKYDIRTRLTSYFEHNKMVKLGQILSELHRGDMALVSSAGMPGISDPGYELVRGAIEAGHRVTVIPGPSAAIAAVACSGLPTDQFTYAGFLPRAPGERRRRLTELANEARTLVIFETPHRLLASLSDVLEILGDRPMAASRELTKLHEEIVRGAVTEVMEHFTRFAPRGEFTLVLGGKTAANHAAPTDDEMKREYAQLTAEGLAPRRAASIVAKRAGLPVRDVYRRYAIEHR